MTAVVRTSVILSFAAQLAYPAALPGRYYRLMETGCASIEQHLDEQPDADLKRLEQARPHAGSSLEIAWAHFGYEGEAFSKGGYLLRGFNDLKWLPEVPSADSGPMPVG